MISYAERLSGLSTVRDEFIRFFQEGHAIYGGYYPLRQAGISDEEIIEITRKGLEENALDPSLPIHVCDSFDKKLQLIIENNPHKTNGDNRLIIVDDQPQQLVAGARNLVSQGIITRNILKRITVVGFDFSNPQDTVDSLSGVRIAILNPSMPRFPTHPTPDS